VRHRLDLLLLLRPVALLLHHYLLDRYLAAAHLLSLAGVSWFLQGLLSRLVGPAHHQRFVVEGNGGHFVDLIHHVASAFLEVVCPISVSDLEWLFLDLLLWFIEFGEIDGEKGGLIFLSAGDILRNVGRTRVD
jgi:hypothetical protein